MYFEALAAGAGGDWWHVVILQAPLGAAVNVTDGDEDIDTVGTGEPMAIPVHDENSTYDITVDATGFQWTAQFNTTSVSGGYEFIDIDYGTIHLTFDDEFRGLTLTVSDGGSNTGTFTAPATGNTVDVFVPTLGTWTVSGTVSGKQYDSRPVTISDYAVAQSTKLILVPVGKTVLPTDDIETWLLCGEIKDKNYTTLDEVLADEATLIKLLTNDNAIDYMKRSTTWIVNPGLVPVLTGATAAAFSDSVYASTSNYPWKAFDNQMASGWQGAATSFSSPQYVGYIFNNPIRIGRVMIEPAQWSTKSAAKDIEIQGSKDTTTGSDGTWVTLYTDTLPDTPNTEMYRTLDVSDAYKAYRLVVKNSYEGTAAFIRELQFYPYKEAITESETAMSYIGAYDYAAEELLDDPVWNAGIMTSDYWEKVLPGLIPVMTSNTTPMGEAIADENLANNEPYRAFDGDLTTAAYSKNQNGVSHIGYDFKHSVKLLKLSGDVSFATGDAVTGEVTVQYYDGTNWNDIQDISISMSSGQQNVRKVFADVRCNYEGTKFRLLRKSCTNTARVQAFALQFYGRATGSVQSWLCAAGIAKPYTTMDEVLADHETLAALMTNHNAVDYLVTAKNLIPDIVGNERAMFYIGRRNYAADSLLADEEWTKAIVDSEYCDKILTNIVPIMLSNTTPEGKASARTENGTLKAFMAFDHSDSTRWCSNTPATSASNPQWIGYEFVNAVKIYKVMVTNAGYTVNNVKNYTLQNGDDDSTRTDVQSGVNSINTAGGKWSFDVLNPVAKKYWGLNITSVISADSGGNTHIGELQFYGRKDVDETQILLRGAAGANIYKKVSGVDVPITTLVGTTDEVTKAQILGAGVDAGEVVIYSDVANDPDSLSNDYHKDVKVDDNTIDIDVMPNDSLYWYGHEDGNLEIISTANGWAAVSGWLYTNPSKSTAYMAFDDRNTSNCISGVGTKNKVKASAFNIHMLNMGIALTRSGSDGVTSHAVGNKSKNYYDLIDDDTNYRITNSLADSVLRHARTYEPIKKDSWISAYSYSVGCARMYGLWLSKHNPAANFFSAANDTVYYVSGGAQVVFAETNDLGEAVVDFSKIPAGDYILYSSVADDPDNLNQKYHKQITVEEDMRYRKIYLMPDGEVLYWYGYVGENAEVMSTANGWTCFQNLSFANPKFESTYVDAAGASGNMLGIGSKIKLNGLSKCIYNGVSVYGGEYGVIGFYSDKNLYPNPVVSRTALSSSGVNYAEVDSSMDSYIMIYSYNAGRRIYVNALWVE